MEPINVTETENIAYKNAIEHVKNIKAFYSHLLSYVLVIVLLIATNLKFSPHHLWFFYPMIGWGIGLLFHAAHTFNYIPFFGKEWEQKKIEQIINDEKCKLKN